MDRKFALSVVIPVYNGAASIGTLVDALAGLDVPGGLEIVLVNDGSPDDSLTVCRHLTERTDVPVTLVNLSRNYGEHNAVMAGLGRTRGAHVITMDDDLQNPPEEVVRLWEYTRDGGFDVVYTYYEKKQHEAWRNLGSRVANLSADVLLDKPKGLYLSSFRCMTGFVAHKVAANDTPYPYVDGLILQVTQNVGRLKVAHLPRAEGRSNYTIRKLVRLWLSIFLNFSVLPLRMASLLGIACSAVGLLASIGVIVEALTRRHLPVGWASLMCAVLLLSGAQMLMLGVVGEYLGRLFLTTNRKPQYVVREVFPPAAERALHISDVLRTEPPASGVAQ